MYERIAPEQHDSLDGVPEPAETPRLFGHEQVSGGLAAAYRTGKLPHALLFAGPQGIGKATLAFHLAHHLLRHPVAASAPATLEELDPGSQLYRQIASGAHPSVLHLTRPMNDRTKAFKTVVTVDEIRKVSRFLSLTSHDGGYRVIIVDPADDMNTNAANALLKNLEEPPPRTLFILVVHAPGGLLPTIRSRCQTIRFAPLDADALSAALAETGSPAPEDEQSRQALADRAGGSVRAAILLTQYGGIEIAQAMEALARAPKIVPAETHRVADAVAGRDQAIPFGIFNKQALDMLADAASQSALSGDLARANRLSAMWQEARTAIDEMETFNLDRKQHALDMIQRLNAAMQA